jgi:hypothetical protein
LIFDSSRSSDESDHRDCDDGGGGGGCDDQTGDDPNDDDGDRDGGQTHDDGGLGDLEQPFRLAHTGCRLRRGNDYYQGICC